jgi:hypothetical protein
LPIQDDEWQEATSNRIDGLSRAVSSMRLLSSYLPAHKSFQVEQLNQSMAIVMRHLNFSADPARRGVASGNNNGTAVPTPYLSPWLSPPSPHIDTPITTAASMAYSLDHSNVDGAEALLAQTETSNDYFPVSTSSGHGSTPPTSISLYHLLDDLINTAPISSASIASSKQGEGLGESDPRPDIIKSGVVSLGDANVLVDQSVP